MVAFFSRTDLLSSPLLPVSVKQETRTEFSGTPLPSATKTGGEHPTSTAGANLSLHQPVHIHPAFLPSTNSHPPKPRAHPPSLPSLLCRLPLGAPKSVKPSFAISRFVARHFLTTPSPTVTMARVYADVNQNMPRSYWDYDSVNISLFAIPPTLPASC